MGHRIEPDRLNPGWLLKRVFRHGHPPPRPRRLRRARRRVAAGRRAARRPGRPHAPAPGVLDHAQLLDRIAGLAHPLETRLAVAASSACWCAPSTCSAPAAHAGRAAPHRLRRRGRRSLPRSLPLLRPRVRRRADRGPLLLAGYGRAFGAADAATLVILMGDVRPARWCSAVEAAAWTARTRRPARAGHRRRRRRELHAVISRARSRPAALPRIDDARELRALRSSSRARARGAGAPRTRRRGRAGRPRAGRRARRRTAPRARCRSGRPRR